MESLKVNQENLENTQYFETYFHKNTRPLLPGNDKHAQVVTYTSSSSYAFRHLVCGVRQKTHTLLCTEMEFVLSGSALILCVHPFCSGRQQDLPTVVALCFDELYFP